MTITNLEPVDDDAAARLAADAQPPDPGGTADALLEVTDLCRYFPAGRGGMLSRRPGPVRAVDGVTFSVRSGETLGLVGETGCGKSTTGRLISRLTEPTAGTIRFAGEDITHRSDRALRPLRGQLQTIFQDPYAALNPRHNVGNSIATALRLQGLRGGRALRSRVHELLEMVGLDPEHYNRFPHEFSGGQRQRINIARALATGPKLVVADEVVSALDTSIQAQVLNLLADLRRDLGLSYVFISHDLAVVRHISDRVAVMYLGKIVELADRDDLYDRPRHPYTQALLSAVPSRSIEGGGERIRLRGEPGSPLDPPSGCRFRTRCWKAGDICRTQEPALAELTPGHQVACHFPEPVPAKVPGDDVEAAA